MKDLTPLCSNHDERPPGALVRLIVIHAISLPPDEFGGPGVEQLWIGIGGTSPDTDGVLGWSKEAGFVVFHLHISFFTHALPLHRMGIGKEQQRWRGQSKTGNWFGQHGGRGGECVMVGMVANRTGSLPVRHPR